MSKTKRRNIKKRNTRRKKTSLLSKNKTNNATRVYKNRNRNRNRNRNKQRKTKHRRSQRGGGIKWVGIDKDTGEHIYWSNILNDYIRVPPLPSPGKKIAPNQVAILENFIRDLPDAGIVDAHWLAFVRDIQLRNLKQQVRALPAAGNKQLPQSFLDKEQEEKDKIFTKQYAEFIEKQKTKEMEDQLDEELAKYEPSMYADDLDSRKPRKLPAYLLTSTELGKSSSRKSPGAVAMATAAKLPGSPKEKRLTYSDFGLNSDDDLGDDSDLGHSPVVRKLSSKSAEIDVELPVDMELANLDKQSKKVKELLAAPLEPRLRPQLVKARPAHPAQPRAATGLLRKFGNLQEEGRRILEENKMHRLNVQFSIFKVSETQQKKLKEMHPCLQTYFLYRLEGRQPGKTGISLDMVESLNKKLKSCSGLKALLTAEGMLPLEESLWVDDSECSHSAIGGEKFGFLTRRHHCRCCGRCVTEEYMDKSMSPRVCDECVRILQ